MDWCRVVGCRGLCRPLEGHGRAGGEGARAGRVFGVWSVFAGKWEVPTTAETSCAGRRHYSPRLPGGFTLPHRSDGTLGRGLGRSLERPCKWSAALSAV